MKGALPAAGPLVLFAAAMALPYIHCIVAAFFIILIAWPVWAHATEQNLLATRAIIEHVATEQGRIRRWFWNGTLFQTISTVAALFWAALLLVYCALLQPLEWAILAADAFIVFALSPAARGWLTGEISPRHQAAVSRHWLLLYANTALLVLAFVAHGYWCGFTDTRDLTWTEVVARAVDAQAHPATCSIMAWLTLTARLATELPQHAAMNLLPEIRDPIGRVLAWVAFLAVTGFASYLYSRLLLGAQSIAESYLQEDRQVRRNPLFLVTAIGTITLVLAIATRSSPGDYWQHVPERLALMANPCAPADGYSEDIRNNAHATLNLEARKQIDASMRIVDQSWASIEQQAERRIDDYLGWHFSLKGQYTQLGALFFSRFDETAHNRFSPIISGFEADIGRIESLAGQQLTARLSQTAGQIAGSVGERLNWESCLSDVVSVEALSLFKYDAARIATSAALAWQVSRVAPKATQGLIKAMLSRQAGKTAATAAGKTAAKRGASAAVAGSTAAAACAPGGPLAAVCGSIAFIASWVGIDLVATWIDEALFREKMKSEILGQIRNQREIIRDDIRNQLEDQATHQSAALTARLDKVFIPATGSAH